MFKNINISLMFDALTFYESAQSIEERKNVLGMMGMFDFRGEVWTVRRKDPNHYLYHQDGSDINKEHVHKQFFKPIDRAMFNNILSALERRQIISADEKQQGLDAYDAAPTLTIEFFNSTPEEIAFNQALLNFYFKICDLKYKARTNPHYSAVAEQAQLVYTAIYDAMLLYSNNKNVGTYQEFQETCNEVINKARPFFKEHRGYSKLLEHVELACGVSKVGYIVAVAAKHGVLFFNNDTLNKSNDLAKAINNIPAP